MPANVETDDIYVALVAELARIALPTAMMGVVLAGVGLFIAQELGHAAPFAMVASGVLAAACRLALVLRQSRRQARSALSRSEARRWEWGYALTTAGYASSIGAFAGTVFAQPRMDLQLLATGLLFGYCSGAVTNLSVRPVLATGALLLSSLPAIVSMVWAGGLSQNILATMFCLFLVASLHGVLSSHRAAIRQIRLRLDMAALARSDALTGLANRLGLRRAFGGLPVTDDAAVAVHCFDLDGFKPVNDRYGHAAGDSLLHELGARLRLLVVAPAVAARVGGDEFVVLQPSVRHPGEAEDLARRIVHALVAPYPLARETVTVGLSLGYALAPSHGADLDDLIRRADEASYAVKRRGGGIAADGGVRAAGLCSATAATRAEPTAAVS